MQKSLFDLAEEQSGNTVENPAANSAEAELAQQPEESRPEAQEPEEQTGPGPEAQEPEGAREDTPQAEAGTNTPEETPANRGDDAPQTIGALEKPAQQHPEAKENTASSGYLPQVSQQGTRRRRGAVHTDRP